ncbi:MAG TPA: DUF1801 domain-containing protein [Candidatus Limnocylindrales bacterium]|jgi:uncharacterized protein YdhG (YjbR/CyaY superfamily)
MPEARKTRSTTFSDEEKAAMRERAREQKAAAAKVDGNADLLAKIAEMDASDREMAERIHAIVTRSAPSLEPKTWYGMPAYARSGKIVCFFQPAKKFKTRYSTLGFNEDAQLDDGSMWPVAYALTELSAGDDARIGELVKKAAG